MVGNSHLSRKESSGEDSEDEDESGNWQTELEGLQVEGSLHNDIPLKTIRRPQRPHSTTVTLEAGDGDTADLDYHLAEHSDSDVAESNSGEPMRCAVLTELAVESRPLQ